MKQAFKYLYILLLVSMQTHAADSYKPMSGDSTLDASLIAINERIKNNTEEFSRLLASEFQAPPEKVNILFSQFEFTAADALMTLSVADLSGEPINGVAKAYMENKKSGWGYTLYQLKIEKGSKIFEQIKKDAQIVY